MSSVVFVTVKCVVVLRREMICGHHSNYFNSLVLFPLLVSERAMQMNVYMIWSNLLKKLYDVCPFFFFTLLFLLITFSTNFSPKLDPYFSTSSALLVFLSHFTICIVRFPFIMLSLFFLLSFWGLFSTSIFLSSETKHNLLRPLPALFLFQTFIQ